MHLLLATGSRTPRPDVLILNFLNLTEIKCSDSSLRVVLLPVLFLSVYLLQSKLCTYFYCKNIRLNDTRELPYLLLNNAFWERISSFLRTTLYILDQFIYVQNRSSVDRVYLIILFFFFQFLQQSTIPLESSY